MKTIDVKSLVTEQEIFDYVWRALKAQGVASKIGIDGACAYRGQHNGNATACGVGLLFADDEYTPAMDKPEYKTEFRNGRGEVLVLQHGTSAKDLVARCLMPPRLVQHLDLLTAIQTIHDDASSEDNSVFVGLVKEGMFDLAATWGLSDTALREGE